MSSNGVGISTRVRNQFNLGVVGLIGSLKKGLFSFVLVCLCVFYLGLGFTLDGLFGFDY